MGEIRTLADACEAIVDCAHKTAPIDPDGEYFAVGTPAMRRNVIDYAEARRINRHTFEDWTQRLTPRHGDLLLAREAPVGPIVQIPREENVAPGQRTVLLRPRPGVAHERFLFYYLASPQCQAALQVKASGSTVPHLNVADVRSLEVPSFPDYSAQQAIAEVLGALDDKIAANDRSIALADDLAARLTTAQCEGSVRLDSIADVVMGSSPPGTSYNETGEGMPFYQGVRDFGTRFPTQRVWTTAPVRTAAKRDTLISVRAPVGRTNLAREDLCLGRGLAGLRSLTSTPMCLFHQVRSARDAWAPYEAEGTVFGAINKDALKGISIPSIPDTKLNQLERQLASLEALIEQSLLENLALAHTRDQLLPLLMSGRVTVKDIEGDIEDIV